MTIGVTSFNQIRDINGYVSDAFAGNVVSTINQCFTLTATDDTSVTVPLSGATTYTTIITVSPGADVFFLPNGGSLTGPDGTPAAVSYQLINNRFVTQLKPGQVVKFLYNSTPVDSLTVTVHMAFYANIADNNLL